ncbi:hypothetical protein AwDysgo_07850 [Bacteroidales bacterium]|nr:hypothetical protein AwDysgo_07850 [Bacteroidales bacterium]
MNDFFQEYKIAEVANQLNAVIIAPQALDEQSQDVIDKAKTIKELTGIDIALNAAWGCGLRAKVDLFSFFPIIDEELNKGIDDIGFISQIVNNSYQNYNIDKQNTFIFGTSMGAYMSYQYALYEGNNLSGLIGICGSMGLNIRNLENNVSLPICDFHSVDDEVVPYEGLFKTALYRVNLCKSKEETIRFWVDKNKAKPSPIVEEIVNYTPSTDKTVSKYSYASPTNEVVHYKIHKASHEYYFKKENGDCMDYNEEIIKFILAHSKDSNTGIENTKNSKLKIYPNPAQDFIQINIDQGQVTIYNLQGQTMLKGNIAGNYFDVSSLKKGCYMVKVSSEKTSFVEKLIIK